MINTAEIMSRYRPIAPKPLLPSSAAADFDHHHHHSSSSSHKIRHSTFLRNVWPQLQARPTRTRKRPRAVIPVSQHNSFKRSRVSNFSLHRPFPGYSNLVTLPLFSVSDESSAGGGSEIDFINSFDDEKGVEFDGSGSTVCEVPEEKDLLKQLQGRVSSSNSVITPHPVRPVGSSIRVGCINEAQIATAPQAPRKPDELEKEVESEVLPAVISDSNNRVRMANSAYKEMVGQPECLWLDSMVTGDEPQQQRKGRRIGGEVMLHLSDAAAVPHSSNGFSCWVRIEWGNADGKKNSVTAFCDVIKLCCVSRDYLFTWRFHTQTKQNRNNHASNPISINV